VQEPHCCFDQVEEHADNADDEVVLCVAGGVSVIRVVWCSSSVVQCSVADLN
jgi:hypothetical protein